MNIKIFVYKWQPYFRGFVFIFQISADFICYYMKLGLLNFMANFKKK